VTLKGEGLDLNIFGLISKTPGDTDSVRIEHLY